MIHAHVAAGHCDGLPVKQATDAGQGLLQRQQRGLDAGPHAVHPVLHPVPDARQNPSGVKPHQCRQLHGGEHGVAHHVGQDANPNREVLRGLEGGGGGCDATPEKEVFDDPRVVESEALEQSHALS